MIKKNISKDENKNSKKLEHFKYSTQMKESYVKNPLLLTCETMIKYEYTYDSFQEGTSNNR